MELGEGKRESRYDAEDDQTGGYCSQPNNGRGRDGHGSEAYCRVNTHWDPAIAIERTRVSGWKD